MGRDYFQDAWGCGPQAVQVVAGEFVVVTHAAADAQVYAPLSALLRRTREAFDMELAFVAEWVNGEPQPRAPGGPGETDDLQATYGRRLLEGGKPMGAKFRFEAVTVACRSGIPHGTLCARYASGPGAQERLEAFSCVARLVSKWFDQAANPA